MPIRIINKRFTDIYGSTLTYLKANVGDFIEAEFDIQESINVDTSSGANSLQNNGGGNLITWLGGNFESEGFRTGQTVKITRYTISSGAVLDSTTTTINWVIDDEMQVVSTLGSWYALPDEAVSIVAEASREGLQLYVNMVGNGSQGSEYSLIDGEVTTFNFDLTGTTPFVGTSVGNIKKLYIRGFFSCKRII